MSVATAITPGLTGWRQGLGYGGLGLPLAFVALPLYVVLPNHYASEYGIPLAVLGAVLLAARLFDALADPLIGRWADNLFARSARRAWAVVAAAAVLLALGFRALFFPAVQGQTLLLAWCVSWTGSYASAFRILAALVTAIGVAALVVGGPPDSGDVDR